jgi:hypothetical protein
MSAGADRFYNVVMDHGPGRQFSIRTLLLGIAAVGVVLAIGKLVGVVWMTLALWSLLLVVAHVAGAAIGHRRRSADPAAADPPHPAHLARGAPLPVLEERPNLLTRPAPLSAWVRHCTIGGSLLGGLGGLGGLWVLGVSSVNGLVLGTISASVLGGFFAFLISSFLAIASNAWDDATREDGGPARATQRAAQRRTDG